MSFEGDVTTLTFSPDNPCNTTITSETGDVLFSVVTEHTKKATYTQVRDTDDEVIGSLEWREVLPDRVTIGHRKPVSYADWMKKSLLPFKEWVHPYHADESSSDRPYLVKPRSLMTRVASTNGKELARVVLSR